MSIAKPRRIGGIIGSVPRTTSGVYGLTKLSEVNLPFAIGGDTYTYAQDGKYWRCHMFSQVGSDTLTFLRGGLVEYLVVGGGGGGGRTDDGVKQAASGGGAGGMLSGARVLAHVVVNVTVGDGGSGAFSQNARGANGSNSLLGDIQSLGGGGGGSAFSTSGGSGGSGGGSQELTSAGSGTSGQGNNGGNGGQGAPSRPGGGGGAGGSGGIGNTAEGAVGGDGLQSNISGSPQFYAGGGGANFVSGGSGVGGNGASTTVAATSGAANTGSGGGGSRVEFRTPGSGGSGIVIVRYQITQAEFEGDEPYYDNVSLLLHMNGANGSTTFTDSSKHRHAVTANGNAQISTAQSKFGGASAAFDGTGDSLTVPSSSGLVFGTGDFTVEFWLRPNVQAANVLYDSRPLGANGNYLQFGLDSNNNVSILVNAITVLTSSSSCAVGQFAHVAIVKSSGTLKIFIGGLQSGSVANSTNFIGSGIASRIGSTVNDTLYLNGYIDDLRITKGVARYTGNFTPPQRELLPNILAGITPSGLLDQYTGAAAAYSLRSLSDAYTGPVVTVRRSSDSAEADFTATEVSDGTLEAWCGAGDGLVKTLYDQSGHGRHGSQSTATAQPKIVSGGVLVTENGLPAIEFDGSNDYLANTTHNWAVQPTDNLFALCVASPQSTGMSIAASRDYAGTLSYKGWQWRLDASTNYMRILNYNGSVADSSLSNFAPTLNVQSLLVARLASSGDHGVFANGSNVEVTNDDSLTAYTPATDDLLVGAVGIIGGTISDYFDGTIQELIIYPVDQSANRVAIEDNINAHYNVFDPTVLLLHMDGTNGSTTFTDSSLNNFTVTANGDASISTAQSKFGGASAYLDGTGDYLIAPDSTELTLGSSDFTLECWFYKTSYAPVGVIDSQLFWWNGDINSTSFAAIRVQLQDVGTIRFYAGETLTSWQVAQTGPSTYPINEWVHLAVTRSGQTVTLWLNGKQESVGYLSSPTASLVNGSLNYIGNLKFTSGGWYFNGYIDDLRITKGRALYTADFTPPTQAHPDPVPYDQDAINYIAAVEAQDGEQLESGVRMAINDFFVGLKDDGVFPAIKSAALLCGARTLAGALVPLVGAAPTNYNFVEATDYDRATGLKGDGSTKYLDSNRANNADPQNDKHAATYSTETNGYGVTLGTPGGEAGRTAVFRNQAGSNLTFRVHTNTVTLAGSNTAEGMLAMSRSQSANFVARFSQSSSTFSVASESPSSSALNIFAAASGEIGFCDDRIAFYSIGESLDLALLDARVSTLVTTIGNIL